MNLEILHTKYGLLFRVNKKAYGILIAYTTDGEIPIFITLKPCQELQSWKKIIDIRYRQLTLYDTFLKAHEEQEFWKDFTLIYQDKEEYNNRIEIFQHVFNSKVFLCYEQGKNIQGDIVYNDATEAYSLYYGNLWVTEDILYIEGKKDV